MYVSEEALDTAKTLALCIYAFGLLIMFIIYHDYLADLLSCLFILLIGQFVMLV